MTYGAGGTIFDPTKDNAMTYAYNLSGAMIEQQYPSGRKVQNVLDADGSLEMVKSRKNTSSGYHAYANNFTYNAAGAVTSVQLGNGTWESTAFNSRLQPTQIALGATQGATGLLDLDYTYGGANNNGNVQTQTITVQTAGSNPGFSAIQSYTYDSLNRLNDATEILTPTGGSATQTWKQTFKYDRYGNRTFDTTANRTTTIPTGCPVAVCNPTANASDNKLKASDGYVFDGSGNTTADAENRTFIYDGENKQVEVRDSTITPPQNDPDANLIGRYWYDGDGKRVKKYVPPSGTNPGETTIFADDAAGKLVAEYSTIVEPAATAKVAYLTNDHLGIPRINTDRDGNITARHDYHPFGEEIATPQRISGLGYSGDTVRKQFTGYERDNETNLDYAKARMFGSSLGRFTSPDPYNIILEQEKGRDEKEKQQIVLGYISQSQKWNRYVYVLNNPLKFTDPAGLSEQGGTVIKHPDRRMVVIKTDEILTVNIETKPANPLLGTGIQLEPVFRYDTEVSATDQNGQGVPDVKSTLYYFNVRGERKDNGASIDPGNRIVETVEQDNEGVSEPEKRSVTVEVKGAKKDIDYSIQEIGPNVTVVPGYDNKITIPGIPKQIGVPVNNKPDPIAEAMRPKRPGIQTVVIRGY